MNQNIHIAHIYANREQLKKDKVASGKFRFVKKGKQKDKQ